MGYLIDSNYSGKGYMIEAEKGMIDFAIQELHAKRIEIRCNAENGQSRRVAERCFFQLEAIF